MFVDHALIIMAIAIFAFAVVMLGLQIVRDVKQINKDKPSVRIGHKE